MSAQTVLVVDDEEAIAEAVRARLESEGYRVLVAADGPQAIATHAAEHPDLVVLDLMLPGMDGLEVCKEIQKERWTPVLMLTARTEDFLGDASVELRITGQQLRSAADELGGTSRKLGDPRAALFGPRAASLGPGENAK